MFNKKVIEIITDILPYESKLPVNTIAKALWDNISLRDLPIL
jgi:hypothetical protein